MEVHHHPQLEHKPKPWKEYFLEFIMIFLAVTMGFIAENIREKISERETEKSNMELVVDNLKEDTASLNFVIKKNMRSLEIIDSLLLLRDKSLKDSNNVKTFYRLYYQCALNYSFISNSSAFELMKNSGSLRFLKNKTVMGNLYKYDYLRKIILLNEGYQLYKDKAIGEAVNFTVFDNRHSSFIDLDQNKGALNRFYGNYFVTEAVISTAYIPQLKQELEQGTKLIHILEEEYHLKKE